MNTKKLQNCNKSGLGWLTPQRNDFFDIKSDNRPLKIVWNK